MKEFLTLVFALIQEGLEKFQILDLYFNALNCFLIQITIESFTLC